MNRKINAVLFLALLLGLLALSFQNCASVKLGGQIETQGKPDCADFAASRPENIYADAQLVVKKFSGN